MFQNIVGPFLDAQLQSLGINQVSVRYRDDPGIVITPNPFVSDEGINSTSEVKSPLTPTEKVHRWTVSIPYQVMGQVFAAGVPAAIASLDAQLLANSITPTQYAQAVAAYSIEAALAPNSQWFLQIDGTWKRLRLYGQVIREVSRYKFLLQDPGLGQ